MVAKPGDKKLSSLPFPAIVGQDDLKRVLLTTVVNDDIDGALIVGEKGTAKSTAVRGLVDLLPEQTAVADCPYGCHPQNPTLQCDSCREREPAALPVEERPVPLVTLPLGATRDRVVGTLSVEDALAGDAEFDPGLLACAHRGILYVDEVNLLEDHLVDVLLDAAASGENRVERDGMSVTHPADFTLIGTMNPEEGDLRPQLRDRFALQATVEGCRDPEDRVAVIDRALEGGVDPEQYADEVATVGETIVEARDRLTDVTLPTQFKHEIAELCLAAGVDGHRGDIAIARTAMTIAALESRETVIESDLEEAARYALPHRLQSMPFEDEPDLEDVLDEQFDAGDDSSETASDDASEADPSTESDPSPDDSEESTAEGGAGSEPPQSAGDAEPTDDPEDPASETGSEAPTSTGPESPDDPTDEETAQPLVPGQPPAEVGSGTAPDLGRSALESTAGQTGTGANTEPAVGNRGARVRTEPADEGSIDAAASVRSAASRGSGRVEREDLRQSVRTGQTGVTIVFAVDASASMRPAMSQAKAVVLELLRESYQQRDEVAFVAFAGEDAEVLLPPTDSVTLAARHLKDLPSGDRTPLPAGLETAREVLERTTHDAAVVVLVTDGRANVADGSPTEATRQAARHLSRQAATVLVVDAGDGARAGLSDVIVSETGGSLVDLEALTVERVREAADRSCRHSTE